MDGASKALQRMEAIGAFGEDNDPAAAVRLKDATACGPWPRDRFLRGYAIKRAVERMQNETIEVAS